ncbi:MAG: hypothetical protein DCC71_20770 [Proteobacteria bacterium]|nr:MAG: hypothetical protein DCC71_20770 [Pseudomonadota bacterium]
MPDRLPVKRPASPYLKYGVPVASVLLATWVTTFIPPIAQRAPFALLFIVVALSSYRSGFGGGLAGTATGVVTSYLWLLEPDGVPRMPDDFVRLGAFVLAGTTISFLAGLRLRTENAERARREWSEVTLASVGDAVLVTDAQGRVLFMNRRAEALTGWTREDARERPVHEVFRIVNEQTREAIEDPIARVRREGRVVGLANHTILLRRDGGETPIDDSGAPIWSEDHHIAGAVLVFRDVTERREKERQNQQLLEAAQLAHQQAEQANRAKDEFLAVLSHELRTPLQAMTGWAQVLRGDELSPAEVRRAAEAIDRNARRQAKLIEEILDVSRIVSGKLQLDTELVNLERVVQAAVEVVRPHLDAKQLTLHIDLGDPAMLLGDPHRLQQVVWNVLSNAVKFTPAGGEVRIRSTREARWVELAITDTGAGIQREFLPHVFDRFRQERSSSTRAFGGLGLGLAIVRHIVELHGGTVRAESDGPGRGATFRIRLPAVSDSARSFVAASAPETGPSLRGLRVLLVDDEPDARELFEFMLRQAGAEVRTAAGADEALAALRSWPPDVVLSDLEMPETDGYRLLERVREAGFGALPVVAVSAYATEQHAKRALAAGFLAHVAKPVSPVALRRVVRDAYDAAAKGPQSAAGRPAPPENA